MELPNIEDKSVDFSHLLLSSKRIEYLLEEILRQLIIIGNEEKYDQTKEIDEAFYRMTQNLQAFYKSLRPAK